MLKVPLNPNSVNQLQIFVRLKKYTWSLIVITTMKCMQIALNNQLNFLPN